MDNNNEIDNNLTDNNNNNQQVDRKKKEKTWNKKITHKFEHEHNFNLNIDGKKLILPSILILAIVIFIILNPFEIKIKKDDNKQLTKKTIKDIKDPEDRELAELAQKIQEEDSDEDYEENTELTGSSDLELDGETLIKNKIESESDCACDAGIVGEMQFFNGNYVGNTTVGNKFKSVYTVVSKDSNEAFIEKYIYKDKNLSLNYLDMTTSYSNKKPYSIVWNGPITMELDSEYYSVTRTMFKIDQFSMDNSHDSYADFNFDIHFFTDKTKGNKNELYKNTISKQDNTEDDTEFSYYNSEKNKYFKIFENKLGSRVVYKIAYKDDRGYVKSEGYKVLANDYLNDYAFEAVYLENRADYDDERAKTLATSLQFVKQKVYKELQ